MKKIQLDYIYLVLKSLLTIKLRATEQPRVPAPKSKHFNCECFLRSKSGSKRHFISFRFKYTPVSANLAQIEQIKSFISRNYCNFGDETYFCGSMLDDNDAHFGRYFP